MTQEVLILPDAENAEFADNPEYGHFEAKFKPKLTTDDCYTPATVYEAVAEWVAAEYQIDRARFVRPFWPGGNYAAQEYAEDAVVVDNPPFSLISQIIREYTRRNIRFFLFAPALVLFTAPECKACYIPVGVTITYANGAKVPTSFVTNLAPGLAVRTAPALYRAVDKANADNVKAGKATLPRYEYPDQVVTAGLAQRWCKYGVDFRAAWADVVFTGALDAQRATGKSIFGGGFLLKPAAAAERAAAERAAAERAAAERWELSDRERGILGMEPKETAQVRLF